ncbi:hypothetical protein ZIOFF_010913 [Zingiber officinale]|uniref:Uncharacterized protein n=1 Tax=Zingiber officinale TaxID=94328 RepID=A0A8J5HHN1_ZINOF|nr:hypothetical protein ZIOFF_010913 [Zingiber officinale]
MSWVDMAQEDKLKEAAAQEEKTEESGRTSIEGAARVKREIAKKETGFSWEQREEIHFRNVVRKKDFICLERANDKIVNILNVLELHTGVFSTVDQKRIVDLVYELQEKGKNHELGELFSLPQLQQVLPSDNGFNGTLNMGSNISPQLQLIDFRNIS